MAIKIADKFDVLTSAPVDSRMVVPDYQSMIDIVDEVRYEGMIVYVEDMQQRYEYINNTFNEIIPAIYNDVDYTLTDQAVTAITNTITTDDVPEGDTNLYFTDTSFINMLARTDYIYTAYSVLPNDDDTENHSITTNFQLMQIEADVPCRVRIYATENGRSNDLTRAFGVAPDPGDALMFDFEITNINTVYNIGPSVMIFSETDGPTSQIYTTTTNLDVTQSDITVKLTYVNFGKIQIPN